MLPGVTEAAPDDSGAPDTILADALATGDTAAALARVLLARLLLPVVATGTRDQSGHESSAEMAVPALVDAAGARALPAFTGLETLRSWRSDARPVPMPGARVIAGAVDEGYDAVVVDVDGPHPLQLTGPVLQRLAEAARRLVRGEGAAVQIVSEPERNPDRW